MSVFSPNSLHTSRLNCSSLLGWLLGYDLICSNTASNGKHDLAVLGDTCMAPIKLEEGSIHSCIILKSGFTSNCLQNEWKKKMNEWSRARARACACACACACVCVCVCTCVQVKLLFSWRWRSKLQVSGLWQCTVQRNLLR